MAYQVQGHTDTVEVQGGTRVVKVREFHVVSLPSETYFQFRRAQGTPGFTNPGPSAKALSDRIEAVLALPEVTDVVYSQNVTPGGKLQDWMTTYYQAAAGAIQGSVESDLAHFGPNFTGAQVADEIAAGGDTLVSG